RILVAGWPALAFLGGTLLVHSPTAAPTETAPVTAAPLPAPSEPEPGPDVMVEREPEPAPELLPASAPEEIVAPAPAPVPTPAPAAVPPALLDHARKLANSHQATTGTRIDSATLRARLGVPAPLADAITAQLT
ncbi:SpdA protein, partial [Streptomyces bacillaris]